MTEEYVTKQILKWLLDNDWQIIAFDFPQSGTGVCLKRDDACSEKNKNSIIPDIICVKNNICTFWENKNRYYYPDYKKVNDLRCDNQYIQSIYEIVEKYEIEQIYYGVGLPAAKYKGDAIKYCHLTDFVIGVSEIDDEIAILYDINEIF